MKRLLAFALAAGVLAAPAGACELAVFTSARSTEIPKSSMFVRAAAVEPCATAVSQAVTDVGASGATAGRQLRTDS